MKKISIVLAILTVLPFYKIFAQMEGKSNFEYPKTKKTDHVDIYHGTSVADPYNWLEDDNSEETKAWVQAQNKVTENYLSQIPYREGIKKRLTELWNYPKYGVPFKEGENYFYFKNDGLQPQSVLYIQKGLKGKAKVFLDPNKLSEDGTVALSTYAVSRDGKYFAYGIARSGSDWNEFFVIDIATNKLLDDHIKWIKFSGIAWYEDGFYYSCFDEPKEGTELSGKNELSKVYYHKIGTKQSDDKLIFSDPAHPDRSHNIYVTRDKQYMILSGAESTSGNSLYYKDLKRGDKEFVCVDSSFLYDFNVIGNDDGKLYIQTNYEAPNSRVVMINTEKDAILFEDIIPEKEEPLQSAQIAGGYFITEYMKDVASVAYVYNMDGTLKHQIEMPGIGSLVGFSAKKDENTAFFSFTSYTFPSTIYKYGIKNNKSEIFRESEINFDFSQYKTEQVFYTSKDGTMVPMFLTYRKDLVKNGQNPTLLYAYGGFNISVTPSFSVANLVLLENGGIFAVANIRGGSEYGESWHEAGMQEKKQNVFDDFIAAAEYLIAENYTSSEKLAIRGGSNGGLLIGACMTQRPELYKVALPAVGVLDMLKFHKFTIGYYWAREYGNSDNPEDFKYLYAYSPLHNIKAGQFYPATLVTTADHDDRVVPAHSFKFIAELQDKYDGPNPVMIRIEEKAGHGAGKSTEKVIEEYTDIWSFVFKNLDVKPIY